MNRTNNGDKLYIQAYRKIRQYMVEQQLQPGDLLPTEQQLCQQLGVSRNVLREAVKSMELMGLIQACPGRGTVVREFNLEFLLQNLIFFSSKDQQHFALELFSLQKVLELGFLRSVFQYIQPRDIEDLRACLLQAEQAGDDIQELLRLHASFHEILFRSVPHQILQQLMDALHQLQAISLPEDTSSMLPGTEHLRSILTSLEEYHYQSFSQAMVNYFSEGLYALQSAHYYG